MTILLHAWACTRATVETGPEAGDSLPEVADDTAPPADARRDNVLLLISDDLGIDVAACYDDFGSEKPPQPSLRALCASGVVFENVTSAPTCSPTRATLLTGRYGFRTGVAEALDEEGASSELSVDERSLPEVIADAAPEVAMASFGKWHLSRGDDDPNLHGWPHFAGVIGGQVTDYEDWTKIVDGVEVPETGYATSVTVDDAAAWIGEQDGPWFAWVGFNAPHAPFHAPPDELHGYDLDGARNPTKYRAMIEAMDTEIGRLLDGLSEEERARTWVLYLGDNGTPADVNLGDYKAAHAKATLYQGGVHVPLVVSGPGVVEPGRSVAAQVDTVDLFTTVLELLDVELSAVGTAVDGVGLEPYLVDAATEPLQDHAYTELHGVRTGLDDAGYAVRGERYKLVRHLDGAEHLFDLEGRFEEETDLLADGLDADEEAPYAALTAILEALGPSTLP